jgi:hypothetical protein
VLRKRRAAGQHTLIILLPTFDAKSASYGGPAFAVDNTATASLRCSNANRPEQQARDRTLRQASPAQGVTPNNSRVTFASWSDGLISSTLS